MRPTGASGDGSRKRLADAQQHCRDFLLLRHYDLLRDARELFVVPIAQLSLRHVDRSLMMRDHHRHKVNVDVA